MRKLIAIFCLICCAANAQTFKALMLNSGTLAIAYPAQVSVPALLAANGIAALTDVATLGVGATNFVLAQGVAQTNDTTLRIAAHGVAQTNDTSTRLASQGVAITNAYAALVALATNALASLSAVTNVVNALVPPATNISVPFYWTSAGVTNASVGTNGTIAALQFVGGGIGIANLNAANVASGTLSDSRLSSHVVLTNTGVIKAVTDGTHTTSNSVLTVAGTGGITTTISGNTLTIDGSGVTGGGGGGGGWTLITTNHPAFLVGRTNGSYARLIRAEFAFDPTGEDCAGIVCWVTNGSVVLPHWLTDGGASTVNGGIYSIDVLVPPGASYMFSRNDCTTANWVSALDAAKPGYEEYDLGGGGGTNGYTLDLVSLGGADLASNTTYYAGRNFSGLDGSLESAYITVPFSGTVTELELAIRIGGGGSADNITFSVTNGTAQTVSGTGTAAVSTVASYFANHVRITGLSLAVSKGDRIGGRVQTPNVGGWSGVAWQSVGHIAIRTSP